MITTKSATDCMYGVLLLPIMTRSAVVAGLAAIAVDIRVSVKVRDLLSHIFLVCYANKEM